MDVVYSSDENYAQHLAVSIVSLLENNKQEESITFYIFDNNITEASKTKIRELCTQYKREVHYIEFRDYALNLKSKINCPISISTYARLFIAELLPASCKRVIYLDCDTVVNGSIGSLLSMKMNNASVAGVLDTLPSYSKKNLGLRESDCYINAGVLLIDVEKWRNYDATDKFLRYLKDNDYKVFYQDQGVINAVLNSEMIILPPGYNVLTPFLTTKYKRLVKMYRLNNFYDEDEMAKAKAIPLIIHYTPEYVGRVWEKKCIHPRRELYIKYLSMTPWKGNIGEPTRITTKLRLIYWMERNLPVWLLRTLGC